MFRSRPSGVSILGATNALWEQQGKGIEISRQYPLHYLNLLPIEPSRNILRTARRARRMGLSYACSSSGPPGRSHKAFSPEGPSPQRSAQGGLPLMGQAPQAALCLTPFLDNTFPSLRSEGKRKRSPIGLLALVLPPGGPSDTRFRPESQRGSRKGALFSVAFGALAQELYRDNCRPISRYISEMERRFWRTQPKCLLERQMRQSWYTFK